MKTLPILFFKNCSACDSMKMFAHLYPQTFRTGEYEARYHLHMVSHGSFSFEISPGVKAIFDGFEEVLDESADLAERE